MAQQSKLIEHNGKQYTIKQLAKMKGVKYYTMRTRLRVWGVDRAMSQPIGKTTPELASKYEYKGKQYTAAELADIAGVKHVTMRGRLVRNGGDAEDAVNLGLVKKTGGQFAVYKVGDRKMTIKEMSQEAGCSISAMRSRIARLGSTEAAMDVKPRQLRNKSDYDKKPSKSAGCPFDRILQEARTSV